MTRKIRLVGSLIESLASGPGAERLPPQLRAIHVQGVRPCSASPTQRTLLKDVLPRLKYSNKHIAITFDWAAQVVFSDKRKGQRPPRNERLRAGQEQAKEAAAVTNSFDMTAEEKVAAQEKAAAETDTVQRLPQLIRLDFDGLPSKSISLRSKKTASELAILISTLAKRTVQPIEEREAYRPRPAVS